MTLAVFAAVVSVLCGAVLGLLPGGQPWARPIRTFATVSAVALVLGRVIPDALVDGGLWVLAVVAGSFLLPTLIERLGHRFLAQRGDHGGADQESRWVLELSFLGLLAHKIGDGIALGTYSTGAHADHEHWEVYAAIAAHTVPITAVMVGVFASNLGRFSAIVRVGLLTLGAAAGVLATGSLLDSMIAPYEPWILAVVGGLLLHVVAHSHPPPSHEQRSHEHRPHEPRQERFSARMLDLVAAGLGLGVLFLGDGHHVHHGGGHHVDGDPAQLLMAAFLDLTLESAPALFLGLLAGAALQLWGALIPMRFLQGGSSLGQAFRGAAVGIPIPICSCGVLPVVESLRRRGGSAAVVTAFLIAAPELGIETFALTAQFFGWPFAFLRLGAAMVVAVVVAVVLDRVLRRDLQPESSALKKLGAGTPAADELTAAQSSQEEQHASSPVAEAGDGSVGVRFAGQFEDILAHIGPWTLLGLIVAAYAATAVQGSVHGGTSAPLSSGTLLGDVLLVTALAIPSYVCAASATPLAAVLVMQGFSPGAALLGLLLGPATNIATFGYLSREFGFRATAASILALLAVGWGVAVLADVALSGEGVLTFPPPHAHGHGWLSKLCLALLVGAILLGVWRRGVGGWFKALTPSGFHTHNHSHEGGEVHAVGTTSPCQSC